MFYLPFFQRTTRESRWKPSRHHKFGLLTNKLFATLFLGIQRLEDTVRLPLAHQAMLEKMLECWSGVQTDIKPRDYPYWKPYEYDFKYIMMITSIDNLPLQPIPWEPSKQFISTNFTLMSTNIELFGTAFLAIQRLPKVRIPKKRIVRNSLYIKSVIRKY